LRSGRRTRCCGLQLEREARSVWCEREPMQERVNGRNGVEMRKR
jgi:hypothetical protein